MTTAIKERPILFNGEMVRAILDGRKTQTRRVVKPQPGRTLGLNAAGNWRGVDREGIDPDSPTWKCPYGVPGERLWVRETWAEEHIIGHYLDGSESGEEHHNILYRADGDELTLHSGFRWRPSIHMPRWASRILLEITDVRVEFDDIKAEWVWVVEFKVVP